IEESRYAGMAPDAVDAGVLKTALDFHLVSRLTSLVAVDKTPARPAGETLDTRQIATMLPKGWDFARVFGTEAEGRALRLGCLPQGAMQRIKARATADKPETDEQGLPLPGTASGWEMALALGLTLILFGAALLHGRSVFAFRGQAFAAGSKAKRATS